MSKIPTKYNLMQVPWKYVQCSELHRTYQHDPKTSMLCVNKSTLLSFQSIIQVKETKFDIIHRLSIQNITSLRSRERDHSHGPGMSAGWAAMEHQPVLVGFCFFVLTVTWCAGAGLWCQAARAAQGPVVIPANRRGQPAWARPRLTGDSNGISESLRDHSINIVMHTMGRAGQLLGGLNIGIVLIKSQ